MFGDGHLRAPVARRGRPDGARPRARTEVAFEFFAKLGVPFFTFHDRDVAPEGSEPRARAKRTSTACSSVVAARDAAHGVELLWGTANLFSHPALRRRRRDQPRSRGLRLRRRAGEARRSRPPTGSAARTTCSGAGARATTRCSTPICAASPSSSAASCSLVVEHKHKIGFRGTLLIEPKPMEPTKHQYDLDAAAVHALPAALRPRARGQAQHRGQPRHARRPQLRARARLRHRQRSLRQRRRESRRPAERLGHRPVPEQRRRADARALHDPAGRRASGRGGFNFDAKLRRQSIDPSICSTPTSAASTRWRARCSPRQV